MTEEPEHPKPEEASEYVTTALGADVWRNGGYHSVIIISGDSGYVAVAEECVNLGKFKEMEQ